MLLIWTHHHFDNALNLIISLFFSNKSKTLLNNFFFRWKTNVSVTKFWVHVFNIIIKIKSHQKWQQINIKSFPSHFSADYWLHNKLFFVAITFLSFNIIDGNGFCHQKKREISSIVTRCKTLIGYHTEIFTRTGDNIFLKLMSKKFPLKNLYKFDEK